MLDTVSANKLITKSGVEVLFITHIPKPLCKDFEYAGMLVNQKTVFLYNKEGKCTDTDGTIENISDFDLILK